ncbi:unnamed protein product [Calypogeia fissa]
MVVSMLYYSCMSQQHLIPDCVLRYPVLAALPEPGQPTKADQLIGGGQADLARRKPRDLCGRTTDGVGAQGLRGPRSGYIEGRSGGAGACVLQDVSSKTGNDGWGRVTSQ